MARKKIDDELTELNQRSETMDKQLAVVDGQIAEREVDLRAAPPGAKRVPLPVFESKEALEKAIANRHKTPYGHESAKEVLRDFELELKPEKTSIIPLPIPQQPSWVVELRNHQFRSGARAQWGDLMSYFDRAFVLAQANPKMIVLKYAVQRIRYQKIAPSNWPLVQEFLFQCLMVETGTFYPVLKQLVEHHVAGRHVDLSAVEEIINYHIVQHCRLGHGSEAAWSVWAAIRFEIPLDKSAAAALSGVSDSIVALLSLDAHHAGLIPSGLDTSHWQTYMTAEALYGEAWLLSYEANVKGWLKSVSGKDHVASDSNFSFLKSEGVCFYDEKRARTAIPTGASVGAGKAPIFSFPV